MNDLRKWPLPERQGRPQTKSTQVELFAELMGAPSKCAHGRPNKGGILQKLEKKKAYSAMSAKKVNYIASTPLHQPQR